MKATELVGNLCFQGVKQLSLSFRKKALPSLGCIACELRRFSSLSTQTPPGTMGFLLCLRGGRVIKIYFPLYPVSEVLLNRKKNQLNSM